MTHITLDDVQHLVDQLSPLDQARLVEHLMHRIVPIVAAAQPAATGSQKADAWARWDQLREEFRALGPASPSVSEQLDADRRDRDAILMGRSRKADVHS